MNKAKHKPDSAWYEVTRTHLGLVYDPAKVNDSKYRDVLPRAGGSDTPYETGEEPPEGHVDASPLGRSIRERRAVLKPVECDEDHNLLDGHDRWSVARRHGIPCPLVMVKGLREDQKRDYIIEANAARRDLDPRIRLDWARQHIQSEEEDYKAGRITHRSTTNKLAVLFGLGHRRVRRLERAEFPERWAAACAGERRRSQNDKLYDVKESDPDSQLRGLLAKLTDETPLDQQEAAVRAVRETLDRFEDLLAAKECKEILDRVDEADRRIREQRAAQEQAAVASGSPRPQPSETTGRDTSIAALMEEIESEPALADPDQRPFTVAISLYLAQRLLHRDELTLDAEWQSRVERVSERCEVAVADLLRLLLRRSSTLNGSLQVLDRLFLAGGGDPAVLRDSLSKHVLQAIFAPAA